MQTGNVRGDITAKTKEFGSLMRSANFKMGSILPENNGYKLSGLEKKSSGASIGLNKNSNQSNFRPQALRAAPVKS